MNQNCQNSCISGVPCCIFVFHAEDDFKNKKETFKTKNQTKITTKKPLMFTKQPIQHAIWSRQKDHGFPIASRSVPVNFSLGPRSSLVRYSLVYRRPIEDRTRNKQKTNERATNVGRETIENSTRSHRHGWLMVGSWLAKFLPATTNQQNAFCLKPAEVKPCTSCPTLSIFSANKTISSIPTDFRPVAACVEVVCSWFRVHRVIRGFFLVAYGKKSLGES